VPLAPPPPGRRQQQQQQQQQQAAGEGAAMDVHAEHTSEAVGSSLDLSGHNVRRSALALQRYGNQIPEDRRRRLVSHVKSFLGTQLAPPGAGETQSLSEAELYGGLLAGTWVNLGWWRVCARAHYMFSFPVFCAWQPGRHLWTMVWLTLSLQGWAPGQGVACCGAGCSRAARCPLCWLQRHRRRRRRLASRQKLTKDRRRCYRLGRRRVHSLQAPLLLGTRQMWWDVLLASLSSPAQATPGMVSMLCANSQREVATRRCYNSAAVSGSASWRHCNRRQVNCGSVFVSRCLPRHAEHCLTAILFCVQFLQPGWAVKHLGKRQFGIHSVYHA
jgi:hypothetical protein